jgi:hypothetical protein
MIGFTLRESLQNRTNSYTEDVKYVGFINYVELWQDPEFTHALSNLLKFTAVFMIGCFLPLYLPVSNGDLIYRYGNILALVDGLSSRCRCHRP